MSCNVLHKMQVKTALIVSYSLMIIMCLGLSSLLVWQVCQTELPISTSIGFSIFALLFLGLSILSATFMTKIIRTKSIDTA